MTHIFVLSHLEMQDMILQECQRQLDNSKAPDFIKLASFYTMSLAYALKKDRFSAMKYLSRAKEYLGNFSEKTSNDKQIMKEYQKLIEITEYFLLKKWDTHIIKFCKEKPEPVKKDPDDPEGKKILIELNYPVEIISITDGSEFTYEDMYREIEETRKNLKDPFMMELESEKPSP